MANTLLIDDSTQTITNKTIDGNNNTITNVGGGGGGAMELLVAATGSDTNASATTVSSIALSGLTALDTILIYFTLEGETQTTAEPILYHVTDGIEVNDLMSQSLLGTSIQAGHVTLTQSPKANTVIRMINSSANRTGNDVDLYSTTTTTAWTGSWTLGLRHGGVTSGGTFHYTWSVYKVAGQ